MQAEQEHQDKVTLDQLQAILQLLQAVVAVAQERQQHHQTMALME
jgi:hypothetical protein